MIEINATCDKCRRDIKVCNSIFCYDCYQSALKKDKYLKEVIEELKEDRDYLNKTIDSHVLVSKEDLELLYKVLCVYKKKYGRWCDKCVLREIPYKINENVTRDLCFAIWHEKILEQ